MNIVVFGATGSIGRIVVKQALARGHRVTAFVRNPGAVEASHENLRVVEGDALDPQAAEAAVRGQDAVLCAIGAGRQGRVRAEATRNIVRAMQATGVKRLICQSSLGVGDSRANLNFFWKHVMFGVLLKAAYQDHVEQERVVKDSGLDWTIVRPAAFTAGERTGRYRHGFAPTDRDLTLKISREDVAEFLLHQLSDHTYRHKTPGLSYGKGRASGSVQ